MMTSGRGSVASSEYCNAILRGIDMLVHHCRAVVADSIHRRRRPSLIQRLRLILFVRGLVTGACAIERFIETMRGGGAEPKVRVHS